MMRTLFFAVWIAYIARLYGLYTYHCHFFPGILTEGFRPLHLSGVPLSIKISVAFWSAKLKCFRIIANKCDTVSRIHRTRTEVAIAYSHFVKLIEQELLLPRRIRWTDKRALDGLLFNSPSWSREIYVYMIRWQAVKYLWSLVWNIHMLCDNLSANWWLQHNYGI